VAKVKRTRKGFRVVHSRTGQPLTGVFKSRARAFAEARKIKRRNRR